MSFDLHAAVTSVLDAGGLTEYEDIAAKVAENVPARELRAALVQALRPYVREMVTRRRMSNPVLHGEQVRRSARSPKVAAIRSHHQAWLRDLIHVDGGNKPLGECTYEDLMFAAGERRENARRNLVQADRFEHIANLLATFDVATVAELPESALTEAAA